MIILDTNVLSALMRTAPEALVVAWLDRQPAEPVWITSITLCEARLGLALPPTGRRRQTLEVAFIRMLTEALENRVSDFDSAAATEAASIAAARQKIGRPVEMRDTQSAARHACHPKRAAFWGSEGTNRQSFGSSRRVMGEFEPGSAPSSVR